jgi:anti-sigma B factor antagonist
VAAAKFLAQQAFKRFSRHSWATVAGWWIGRRSSNVREVELKVTCRQQGEYVVMSVQGEIDLYTVPRLQRALASVLASGGPVRLVVDLSGVDFCDSTGVNVLLAGHRQAREAGGDLELAAPRPAVRKILQVTGLEAVFTVTDNPAQAVGS